MFPQLSGLPGPDQYFDAHWYIGLKAAGIADFHFHDIRHSTASMLAAQGASLLEIADVPGHKTLTLVKRYSHLVVDHKAKVIERWSRPRGSEPSRILANYTPCAGQRQELAHNRPFKSGA